MATFLMLGNYSSESLAGASARRTEQAVDLIKDFGGKVQSMYATLGPSDLFLVIDFPGTEEAMKASIALNKLTNIAFTTSPAVPVEVFDKLVDEI
jgi:uncharacterized protein with GYD domain